MSDPFESLRSPGGLSPLPPEEIRRRGDRRRRRRTTLQVLGTATAVAIVAGGVGFLTTSDDTDAVPAPKPGLPTETPRQTDDGLVLTTEQLEGALDHVIAFTPEDPGPRTLDCQAAELSSLGAKSVTTRAWSGRMDDGDVNGAALAVLEFKGPGATKKAYETVSSWVETCDPQLPGAPELEPSGTSSGTSTGSSDGAGRPSHESTSSLFTSPTADGVRGDQQGAGHVGNSLVLLSLTREFLGNSAIDVEARWNAAMEVALLVASGQTPDLVGGTQGSEIPDDIGLTNGWPSDESAESPDMGIAGPNRVLPRIEFSRCGGTFTEPMYIDRLRASWTNPEDYRSRALTTFENAGQAVAYVDALAEFYRACPEGETDAGGFKPLYEVRQTQLGGQSYAVVQSNTYDGNPGIGLETIHIVRVGRSVLVDVESNEGSLGSADEQLDTQAENFGSIISAMCLFTVAGC